MNNLKSPAANIALITLPILLFLFLILEVVFRLLIPAAEKPLVVFDEVNGLLRSHEHKRTTGVYTMGRFAEIRSHWRTNNFGWNSPIDYHQERTNKGRICVIGDSYVRALQVDVGKDVSSLLRKKMSSEYEVYSFGHDGAPLSQYLHISRYVNRYFSPDILIFVLIHNDFDESIANFVHKPYFLQLGIADEGIEEIEPTTRRLYQFLTYSATFRYVYSNLKLASLYFDLVQGGEDFNANVNAKALSTRRGSLRNVAEYLLTKIQAENFGKRIIFMMNAPVNDIQRGQLESSSIIWINEMVNSLCVEHSLECLDLTTPFYKDYKAKARRFDVPMDGHWNEYAHKLASRFLNEYLTATER